MIKINLVPQDILDKELQKQRMIQVGAAVGALVLVFAGISYGHYAKKANLKKELEVRKVELKKLAHVKQMLEQAKRRKAQVIARRDVIRNLLASRGLLPHFMTDLVRSLEPGVWLKSLNTGIPDDKTVTVSMTASAASPLSITNYLRALDSTGTVKMSGRFTGAKLGAITFDESGADNFSLSMTYKRQ